MTHDQIISQVSQRRLRTTAPTLRVLTRPEPEVDPEACDVIAWAKSHAARGHRLAIAPAPEPRKPRQSFKNNPEQRYLLNRGGWWHFQRITKGEVVRFALNTRDLALAQARRDEFLQNTQP